jgi:hypothetical protein
VQPKDGSDGAPAGSFLIGRFADPGFRGSRLGGRSPEVWPNLEILENWVICGCFRRFATGTGSRGTNNRSEDGDPGGQECASSVGL